MMYFKVVLNSEEFSSEIFKALFSQHFVTVDCDDIFIFCNDLNGVCSNTI